MSHICGFVLNNGRKCQHRVGDPAQLHCPQHLHAFAAEVTGRAPTARKCQVMQEESGQWRCQVHSGAAWETAAVLGARPPCKVPLPAADRKKLAKNRRLDATTAHMLANDPNRLVRRQLAKNPQCPPETLELLASDLDDVVRAGAAMNSATSAGALCRLSWSRTEQIRMAVASNIAAPDETLLRLSNDQSAEVVASVARNPRCPATVAYRLAQHPDATVLVALGERCTDQAALQALYRQHSGTGLVVGAIAHNRHVSPQILSELFKSAKAGSALRGILAGNPACEAHVLDQLSRDVSPVVRRAVAGNPNCPPETLHKLSQDSNPWVKASAQSTDR